MRTSGRKFNQGAGIPRAGTESNSLNTNSDLGAMKGGEDVDFY